MSAGRHPSLDDRFDPAIRIVEYDAAWPARAQAELQRIRASLDGLAVRVEHIGSTAVPGLAAKPILDLQASVSPVETARAYLGRLDALGYLFAPNPDSPDHLFFAKPPERPRSYHLHLWAAGSRHELRHLAVRDYLRAHGGEAARYAQLKRELVVRHPRDRLAYIAGKECYVRELERRALAWRGSATPPAPPSADRGP